MEKISICTDYWLFKKYNIDNYYVRIKNRLYPDNAVWMIGYKTLKGGVTTVGATLGEKDSNELEKEFKKEFKND